MTAVALTNTLTNGTTEDADEVQQNFVDLRDYINDKVIRQDGANSMAAALTLSGDPSAASHATRRSYVDGCVVLATGGATQSWVADTWATVKFSSEVRDTTDGGTAATNYTLASGVFVAPSNGIYLCSFGIAPQSGTTDRYETRVSFDGTLIEGFKYGPGNWTSATTGNSSMSAAWYCASGQQILPQLRTHNSVASQTFGAWLSIVRLHS